MATQAREPTVEEEQSTRSFERWKDNIAGKGKTARLAQHHHQSLEQYPLPYTHRPSSTLSGVTVVEDEHQSIELPPAAHFSRERNDSRITISES